MPKTSPKLNCKSAGAISRKWTTLMERIEAVWVSECGLRAQRATFDGPRMFTTCFGQEVRCFSVYYSIADLAKAGNLWSKFEG